MSGLAVVVRADSSARIGAGHVARCHTLARELRARGADVRFVCRQQRGHIASVLSADGFAVSMLPAGEAVAPPADGDYRAWLGVPPDVDAEETIAAIGDAAVDWLVVDHYALDAEWERRVGAFARQVLVIDDLADRAHSPDVLLDQNWFGDETPARYAGLVPPSCRMLLGPDYALLRPEFAAHRRARQDGRRRTIGRVFVYFGADVDDIASQAMEALSSPRLRHLAVDFVVGSSYPRREGLERRAAERGKVEIHGPRPHLADLIARADLAIGAGGATTWERICLGVPSLVVTVAANQEPGARKLHEAGLITLLGRSAEVTAAGIESALAALVEEGIPAAMPGRLIAACDGDGARRVADVLCAVGSGSVVQEALSR